MGLDVGKKRIGVSICDENRLVATPFKLIIKDNFQKLLNDIKIIVDEYNIKGIIIGNPINMDGTLGPSAQSVKDISILLSKNITVPIILWDERLSTKGAYNLSSQLDIKAAKKKQSIDKNAATFILQGAIDYLNN